MGQLPLTGLGPSLSFAGLVLAVTLLVVELAARDVSLTLVAAPLAAIPTICANLIGLVPGVEPVGARGVWLFAHIALSFVGIAAFATAAAAGCMYLVERRELKSRRFGAIFRFFPPLATLDRVNHVAAIAGWLGLTLGVVLAVTYSLAYHEMSVPKLVWATGAWLAVCGIALGRVRGRLAGAARGELLERLASPRWWCCTSRSASPRRTAEGGSCERRIRCWSRRAGCACSSSAAATSRRARRARSSTRARRCA